MRHTVRAPASLGECLAQLFREASGKTRKQMLAAGRVRVNDRETRRADVALVAGDVVEVGDKGPRVALPARLDVVHEDRDVIVVDKPSGLLSIATERERQRTVFAYLMARAKARRPPGGVFIVHRLDRQASGLLVFATTQEAKMLLQAQFESHTVDRTYVAVVEGRLASPSGTIRSRLLDDEAGRVRATKRPDRGREAVTHWRVVRSGARYTMVEVTLETGRRNQIRVHLAGEGHPIAGDSTYGARTDPLGRLALHAHVLGFQHPGTGKRMRFVSAVPGDFAKRMS